MTEGDGDDTPIGKTVSVSRLRAYNSALGTIELYSNPPYIDVHPSAQVLESLARALRLTPNERRHLFLLAGQPLPPPSPAEENVSPALQQMLDDLNPSPAYILGRRYDCLAWNTAADGFFAISDMFSDASSPYARNMSFRHSSPSGDDDDFDSSYLPWIGGQNNACRLNADLLTCLEGGR
jgi:MmyB-like transcription regulator ligand binding domain